MTTIDRPVRRETASTYRGRPLVIELHPGYLEIRPKGKRTRVAIPYDAVLELGWKMIARAERVEKIAAKKRRGKEKPCT